MVQLEVGKKYLVSSVNAKSPLCERAAAYPWGDKSTKVPIQVIGKTAYFYNCTVLPHYSNYSIFGKSHPYNITISQTDINLGEFKIYDMPEEFENGC